MYGTAFWLSLKLQAIEDQMGRVANPGPAMVSRGFTQDIRATFDAAMRGDRRGSPFPAPCVFSITSRRCQYCRSQSLAPGNCPNCGANDWVDA